MWNGLKKCGTGREEREEKQRDRKRERGEGKRGREREIVPTHELEAVDKPRIER